jgi:arylsulfatase A
MTANNLPWRVMVTPDQPGGLPHDEHTIAELLKSKGYATGMSGKWHLGISNRTTPWAHMPTAHGFDSYVGIPFTNMPYCRGPLSRENKEFCMVMANHTVVQQPTVYDNLTDTLTGHAVDFITRQAATKQPFFFLMSFVHVHSPLFTSPRFTNVSQGGKFGDNVAEMDWSVGEVVDTLDRLGLSNDTLIFFVSDNGPYAEEGWDNCGRSGGLKGSKGQTYEGGIRVPGIARWPGTIPDHIVQDTLVSSLVSMP